MSFVPSVQELLDVSHFCPRHGRASRPIEIVGLRCDCPLEVKYAHKCEDVCSQVNHHKVQLSSCPPRVWLLVHQGCCSAVIVACPFCGEVLPAPKGF